VAPERAACCSAECTAVAAVAQPLVGGDHVVPQLAGGTGPMIAAGALQPHTLVHCPHMALQVDTSRGGE